jgi:hypothetical protein
MVLGASHCSGEAQKGKASEPHVAAGYRGYISVISHSNTRHRPSCLIQALPEKSRIDGEHKIGLMNERAHFPNSQGSDESTREWKKKQRLANTKENNV